MLTVTNDDFSSPCAIRVRNLGREISFSRSDQIRTTWPAMTGRVPSQPLPHSPSTPRIARRERRGNHDDAYSDSTRSRESVPRGIGAARSREACLRVDELHRSASTKR